MDERRNENGTFKPGVCGNPSGRPKKKAERMRLPMHFRDAIRDVGQELVTSTSGETMTGVRAVLVKLRNKALAGHVPSMKLYLQLSMDTAEVEMRHVEGMLLWKELAVELREENEALREKVPKPQTHGVLVLPAKPGSTADWSRDKPKEEGEA